MGADAFVRPADAERGVTASSILTTVGPLQAFSLRALRATPDKCVRGYTLWDDLPVILAAARSFLFQLQR